MVNQQTQQFMFKAVVLTVCAILVGSFVFMSVAALKMGDGEAVRIIDAMQTPVLGAFGTLIAFLTGHQASQALIAKFTGGSTSSTPAAPAAAPVASTSTSDTATGV